MSIAAKCDNCGESGALKRPHYDAWDCVYEQPYLCAACCEDEYQNQEPPEPDLMAVSFEERAALAWEEKRRLS